MRIVVPLAGRDALFLERYKLPKPLCPVNGTPLVRHVLDTVGADYGTDFSEIIFICHPQDIAEYAIDARLRELFPYPNLKILATDGPTEGAACTVLLAKEHINDEEPLAIYLADIIYDSPVSLAGTMQSLAPEDGGSLLCFESQNPKYSYAELEEDGSVRRVAEKEVISTHASAGVYLFKQGRDFVKAAERMSADPGKKVRNAFFICPVYNEVIALGKRVLVQPVEFRHGLGTPDEFEAYLATLTKSRD